MTGNSKVRIFSVSHGTQLLVIQHLRCHLQLPKAREFLVWHPLGGNPLIDRFMQSIIETANFEAVFDVRHFESLRPRTESAIKWWFESTRRLRCDARYVRQWMKTHDILDEEVELWADDPIHFNVNFFRGFFRKARHVKFPHGFDYEDETMPETKKRFEAKWHSVSWVKRNLFWPWQTLWSGVELRLERCVVDTSYTFDRPSPWGRKSVDVSELISMDAFAKTYHVLPSGIRAEIDAILEPIRTSQKPLVFLLLFGLGPDDSIRIMYQQAVARIFTERASELRNCTLVVKWHPGATGSQEKILLAWLRANVPARIHEIRHPLNLEFMLPQLRPNYVVAGLCGSLPIVRTLGAGKPILLADLRDSYIEANAAQRAWAMQFQQGIEIW